MPPRISDAERQLIAGYTEAAGRIERLVREAQPKRKRFLMTRVDAVLRSLEDLTRGYIQNDIPAQFLTGSNEAIKQLRQIRSRVEINESFTQVHKEAVQQIADDASLSFGRGVLELRKSVERTVSTARKQEIINELIIAEVSGASATERVKKIFEDADVFGIRVGNRTLSIDHYASMLAHTIVAEAHNSGAATRYAANGVEYGIRVERADAPDAPCQWMRNKVVWLGEPRFVGPVHPNCMGGIKPYFGDTSQAYRSIDDPRIPEKVRKVLAKG